MSVIYQKFRWRAEATRMSPIRAIAATDAAKICGGQVLPSAASAVKELLENSIDAKATQITVCCRLRPDRLDVLVCDNGAGIPHSDRIALCQKHSTSKIGGFGDLVSVSSFGFRGEALNAACEMAGGLACATVCEIEPVAGDESRVSDLIDLDPDDRTRRKESIVDISIANASSVMALPAEKANVNSVPAEYLEYDSHGVLILRTEICKSCLARRETSFHDAACCFPSDPFDDSVAPHLLANLRSSDGRVQTGTIIIVRDLFSRHPVRKQQMLKKWKQALGKIQAAVQAYAIACSDVSITLELQTGDEAAMRRRGQNLLKTMAAATDQKIVAQMRERVGIVFGQKLASQLVCVEKHFDASYLERFWEGDSAARPSFTFRMFGCVSRWSHGRGAGDRQILFVNRRPIDWLRLSRACNECFRDERRRDFPALFLHLELSRDTYDVNVTPDKRTLFFDEIMERVVCAAVKFYLKEQWLPHGSNGQVFASQSQLNRDGSDARQDLVDPLPDSLLSSRALARMASEPSSATLGKQSLKYASDSRKNSIERVDTRATIFKAYTPSSSERCRTDADQTMPSVLPEGVTQESSTMGCLSTARFVVPQNILSKRASEESDLVSPASSSSSSLPARKRSRLSFGKPGETNLASSSISDQFMESAQAPTVASLPTDYLSDHPILISDEDVDSSPQILTDADLPPVLSPSIRSLNVANPSLQAITEAISRSTFRSTDQKRQQVKVKSGQMQRSLSDIFCTKQSLASMRVLGQFNRGFIIALHDAAATVGNDAPRQSLKDAFIIDQHASDEIWNFHRIRDRCFFSPSSGSGMGVPGSQSSQVEASERDECMLRQQRLLVPLPLELTPEEVVLVQEFQWVFEQNGFDIASAQQRAHSLPSEDHTDDIRLVLKAAPYSRNTSFGASDVYELVAQIKDHPPSFTSSATELSPSFSEREIPRPKRLDAMIASRACRSSIMFGDSLTPSDMQRVLEHLSEIENPWACPHGRPTMRHLCDMRSHAERAFMFVPHVNAFQSYASVFVDAARSSGALFRRYSSDSILDTQLLASLGWKETAIFFAIAQAAAENLRKGTEVTHDPALVLVDAEPNRPPQNDLFQRILSNLSPPDLVSAALVSRLWWHWVRPMLGY